MILINPIYSFLQFTYGNLPADCEFSLPVAMQDDIKFQVAVSGSPEEMTAIKNSDQFLYAVNEDAVINTDADLTNNLLLDFILPFSKTQISDTKIVLCWSESLDNILSLADDTCFRFAMKVNGQFFISNCFKKDSDIRYTSTLDFSADSDAFGFNYCAGYGNKVRLPIFITKPQVSDSEVVYARSDGSRKILSSISSKSYEGKTDNLPFDLHEKIKVSLSHDFVFIESYHYTGEIRKDGGYEIDWPDFMDERLATASFTVFATPYNVRNNNCGECVEYISCVPISMPDFTLNDAEEGEVFSQSLTLTGTLPYALVITEKPAWIQIIIAGDVLTFSGTPGNYDSGVKNVKFTVSNACGNVIVSKTITVIDSGCVRPAINGYLPPATVGVLYEAEWTILGTQPFTLTVGQKPSWMTVTLEVDKIRLIGTPDSPGQFTVYVEVGNCYEVKSNKTETGFALAATGLTWNYNNLVGLQGNLRITKNGTPVVDTNQSGSGFVPILATDSIGIVVQSGLTGGAIIDLTGDETHYEYNGHISSYTFTADAASYNLFAESNANYEPG